MNIQLMLLPQTSYCSDRAGVANFDVMMMMMMLMMMMMTTMMMMMWWCDDGDDDDGDDDDDDDHDDHDDDHDDCKCGATSRLGRTCLKHVFLKQHAEGLSTGQVTWGQTCESPFWAGEISTGSWCAIAPGPLHNQAKSRTNVCVYKVRPPILSWL